MKRLAIAIFTVLWMVGLANAQEKIQVYKNYLPEYGHFYQHDGFNWQKHENYFPKYGNYLKQESNRMQIHENYLPKYGDFYKNGIKYKNYLPEYSNKIVPTPNSFYPPSSSIHSYGTQEFSSTFMPFFFQAMEQKAQQKEWEERLKLTEAKILIEKISSGAIPYAFPTTASEIKPLALFPKELAINIPESLTQKLTPEGVRLKQLIGEVAAKEVGERGTRLWVQRQYNIYLDGIIEAWDTFNNTIEKIDKSKLSKEEYNKKIESALKHLQQEIDINTNWYSLVCDWAVRMGYADESDDFIFKN